MKKKLLSTLLVCGMLASQTLLTSAEEIIVTQDTDLLANPAVATVTASVYSQYRVTIPKNMEMTRQEDGSYQCNYTVNVEAEIAANEYVSVIPQNEVLMTTEGKEDVPVVITQEVQHFRSSYYQGDVSAEPNVVKLGETNTAEGNISVSEGYSLSAGEWTTAVMFTISLNDENTTGTSLDDEPLIGSTVSANDLP